MKTIHIALVVGYVILSYWLGCVSSSYYITKARIGKDIRYLGSGNAGAQNVGKVLGRPWFVVILLLDMLKGYVVVLGGVHLGVGDVVVTLAIVAVVSGHIWPAQMRFRGGMGIATSLGAVLAFHWFVMADIVAIFAVTYFPQVWSGRIVARKAAARSAVAAINLTALSMVLLKQPLMSWLSLIILGFVHYAAYRSRLARGWPHPARDKAAA
ncbi:glycerol-3-phosphate acyltransferase [Streptomyces sp. NBC_00988]|uniref:glycerol-3-phosphate acyltransferase n=1 Tax=Streptomyces sp. NBC_00988 TaxID=2903704 RepID=UPI003865950E|nr:glycerol-3-phosphate acyltransferase [Streptomyces sp. NBC_00988]